MHRVIQLILREYKATVRTKGFIIGLVIAPIIMCGSIIAMKIFESRVDTVDKRVVIVDHSGELGLLLIQSAAERNKRDAYDSISGEKLRPEYVFEIVGPDSSNLSEQLLSLSDRVRSSELHGFLEIGRDVFHPGVDFAEVGISYFARNAALDRIPRWLQSPVNRHLREVRLSEAGMSDSMINDALVWLDVEKMGLVSKNEITGQVIEAESMSRGEALGKPIALLVLMFMMIMFGVSPLLSAVMEEKSQRIAEVLLGSVTPFELMMGKVLGGVAVAMTVGSVYTVIAVIGGLSMGLLDYVPVHLIGWFFVYMILAVFMFGAYAATLGSLCSEPKDAQNLTFPSMLPIMLPMFMMIPVASEPLAGFATWLSFFPPFTPTLMLVRMATPLEIPSWQPWLGLVLVILFSVGTVWVGGRVFRIGILMQGKPPRLSDLVRWIRKG